MGWKDPPPGIDDVAKVDDAPGAFVAQPLPSSIRIIPLSAILAAMQGTEGESPPEPATSAPEPAPIDAGPPNGARDVPCFNCQHSIHLDENVPREGGGFHHQFRCLMGLEMPSIVLGKSESGLVVECPSGSVTEGFQIGGYYSKMWFERHENAEPNSCMDWMICSDGEFPTETPEIEFHICDFRQIERFVAFWGKELRRRGWIVDDKE